MLMVGSSGKRAQPHYGSRSKRSRCSGSQTFDLRRSKRTNLSGRWKHMPMISPRSKRTQANNRSSRKRSRSGRCKPSDLVGGEHAGKCLRHGSLACGNTLVDHQYVSRADRARGWQFGNLNVGHKLHVRKLRNRSGKTCSITAKSFCYPEIINVSNRCCANTSSNLAKRST